MSLELWVGPMFAGKSSALQSIVKRHQSLGWPMLVINHSSDTRYGTSSVVNHDNQRLPAKSVKELIPLLKNAEFIYAKLIVIDEGQFFEDLLPFVTTALDLYEKHIVVVGLDGDAERKPFGQIGLLLPHCDKIIKMTALCSYCKDGTAAIFTYATRMDAATAAASGVPYVGATESYIPLCRRHYRAAAKPHLKESSKEPSKFLEITFSS
jgi:thymidine kinase